MHPLGKYASCLGCRKVSVFSWHLLTAQPGCAFVKMFFHMLAYTFFNRYLQPWTQTVLSSGRCTVNVWGAISKDGLGPLVRIEGRFQARSYCAILEKDFIPYVLDGPFKDGCCLLQHDRSSVHTARSVKVLLEDLAIRTLEWPPVGADLNPIESVWGLMKKRLAGRRLISSTSDALWTAVKEEWEALRTTQRLVSALYESMPRRVAEVIAADGHLTRY